LRCRRASSGFAVETEAWMHTCCVRSSASHQRGELSYLLCAFSRYWSLVQNNTNHTSLDVH
jgi:hypothetical protein